MCQRVMNFSCPLFISQSHSGSQKVWVKLSCMFVEVSPPWCMRVMKMHKGVEFSTLCRCVILHPLEGEESLCEMGHRIKLSVITIVDFELFIRFYLLHI